LGGRLPLNEAKDVADMMVLLGLAIPAQKWIDAMIVKGEESALDAVF
jgi:hypothetical protein